MLLGNMSLVLISAFSARIRTFMIINTVLTVLIISYFSLIWFMGLTVIGIFVVYLIICFRGFCFGYTISSIILALGNLSFIIAMARSKVSQTLPGYLPAIVSLLLMPASSTEKMINHEKL